MLNPLANLYAALDLDSTGFDRGMKAAQGQARSFAADFKKGVGLGAGFSLGTKAASAFTDGVGQAISFVGDAIGMASDLSEQVSKVDDVFGSAAGNVKAWGKTTADAIGISEREALTAAGTFGAMFRAMGLVGPEAADLSRTIVKLGADLGSFYNVAEGDALAALKSGLVGEAEPLRRFGVLLNAAAVEAKAFELGLARTKAEITEQVKVMARMAIIQEQTAIAQGNFQATSDGLANSMKQVNAQLADAQAAIGTALLPVARDFAIFARDKLVPIVVDAAKQIGDLGDVIEDFYALVTPGGTQRKAVIDVGRSLAEGFKLTNDEASRLIRHMQQADAALAAVGWDEAKRGAEVFRQALIEVAPAGRRMLQGLQNDLDTMMRDVLGGSDSGIAAALRTSLVDPIDVAFKLARREVTQGFGNLKKALADPPMLISRETRLENMQKKMRAVMKNLRQAIAADDPYNVDYWTRGAVAVATRMDALSGAASENRKDVRRVLRSLGLDANTEWTAIVDTTTRKSRRAATVAIGEAERIKSGIDAIDLGPSGTALIGELTTGIRGGFPELRAAVAEAAAIVAAPLEAHSPPRVGPLREIDRWGTKLAATFATGFRKGLPDLGLASTVPAGGIGLAPQGAALGGNGPVINITVNGLYGGPAGLRQLQSDIDRAIRPTRRSRQR